MDDSPLFSTYWTFPTSGYIHDPKSVNMCLLMKFMIIFTNPEDLTGCIIKCFGFHNERPACWLMIPFTWILLLATVFFFLGFFFLSFSMSFVCLYADYLPPPFPPLFHPSTMRLFKFSQVCLNDVDTTMYLLMLTTVVFSLWSCSGAGRVLSGYPFFFFSLSHA